MMDCFDLDWCCRIAQQTGIQVDTPQAGVAPQPRRSSPPSQKQAITSSLELLITHWLSKNKYIMM
jgi:hypothetical protein